mmetsp:Transcript_31953/g.66681  ORF Transcript_31953/g.66681 Transcript_31953/m.66681 type:complete len:90 (+) Transcript_31953:248-517(+)
MLRVFDDTSLSSSKETSQEGGPQIHLFFQQSLCAQREIIWMKASCLEKLQDMNARGRLLRYEGEGSSESTPLHTLFAQRLLYRHMRRSC